MSLFFKPNMKINIIGGGIIGLFTAYYLRKEGHEVHVFDKGDLSDGCSYGNAGMITPSHFVPLAAPGVVAQGIRWMFRQSSPFYIRPRPDVDLLHWLWRFYRSCNRRQAEAAMPVLRDFNLLGKKLYRDFYEETKLDFSLEERGILFLYKTAKKGKEETEAAGLANKIGVEARVLSGAEVRDFETGTATDALGGVYYPTDAHFHPNQLMDLLKNRLRESGVFFHPKKEVTGFRMNGRKVAAMFCGKEEFSADAFVVASGSWSAMLLKNAGVKLLLQDGKGYSLTLKSPAERPRYATIFMEARVAVTPMGDDLRFGGTLELGGLDPRINLKRVKGILDAIPRYYPNLEVEMPAPENIWHGYRPCSPDGLPYIGRLKDFDNLVLATGHAMMGVSLAPATGLMVSNILNGKAEGEYARFFDPNRYG